MGAALAERATQNASSRIAAHSDRMRELIVPALMYHDIVPAGAEDSSGFPGRDAALYKVTPDVFEAHLAAMIRRPGQHDRPGRRASHSDLPGLPDLSDRPDLPAITFDDGGLSAVLAADILERHGGVGQFFVTVDYIGTPGFMTARDIRALRTRGQPFQPGCGAVIARRTAASGAESSKLTVSPCIDTPSRCQSSARSTFTGLSFMLP